jgi:tetratricopeptide (TPR) repeat protein
MIRRLTTFTLVTLVLCMLAQGVVMAQAMSTARGIIENTEGTPLKGVRVLFRNTAREDVVYDTVTNKKGRYYIDNLLYYQNQDGRWLVTVELEGYVATSIHVESRTQTRLVEKFTKNIGPDVAAPALNIRPLGEAHVNFVLTPLDQLAQVELVQEEDTADDAPVQKADPWDQALRLANEGSLEESVEFFEKAVEDEADNAGRFDTFAKVLYQLEDYDAAEEQARRAIALDPTLISTHMVIYSVQVAREDYDAARLALVAAAEQDPSDLQVMEQRAWLASQTGNLEESVEAYVAISTADPENVDAWVALGGLYAEQGLLDQSAAAYQRVVELDPANAYQTFFNIGVLIENKSVLTDADNKKVVTAFRKAVEIKPDYAEAWRRLAFASLRTGDMAGAREGLEKYIELSPDAADAAQVQGMLKALPK